MVKTYCDYILSDKVCYLPKSEKKKKEKGDIL